jgi:hypothetical protein
VGSVSAIEESETRHNAARSQARMTRSTPKPAPRADFRPVPATTEDPFPMESTGTGSFRSF